MTYYIYHDETVNILGFKGAEIQSVSVVDCLATNKSLSKSLNVEWVLLVKQQSMEGIGSQNSVKKQRL